MSLKDEIFGLNDREYQEVDVPEWGRTVWIRALSGSERDRYESSLARMDRKKGGMVPDLVNSRARLVAMSVVESEGSQNRVFGDDDVLKLGGKSAKALTRIWKAACELSGLSEAEIEEIEESFEDAQSDDSTTD